MKHDGLKGKGVWTGCHSFENIICDGHHVNQSRPRNGALKQGGTYWYYYKLDDAEEAWDPATPTTALCPLLPGQTVNVLHVPVEVIEAPRRVCSASGHLPTTVQFPMTVNPEDRYKKMYSKPPTKLPRFYCSSDAVRERFNADSRFTRDLGLRQRPASRADRCVKRVRRDEPEYLRPGACQIDVTMQDMDMLANVHQSGQDMEKPCPLLRPFASCASTCTTTGERPPTRGGSNGLGFSFFGSLQDQDVTMQLENSPPQLPQYDGTFDVPHYNDMFDEPHMLNTEWPPSPPMSELADEENWPLPPGIHFRNNLSPVTPIHGPSTLTLAIPILNLDNQHRTTDAGSFDMASPTLTADTMSSPGIPTPDRFRLSMEASKHTTTRTTHPSSTQERNPTTSTFTAGLEDLGHRLSGLYTSSECSYYDDHDTFESLNTSSSLNLRPVSPTQRKKEKIPCSPCLPFTNAGDYTVEEGEEEEKTVGRQGREGGGEGVRGIADEFSSDVFGALGLQGL
jgi:hypothetical protein